MAVLDELIDVGPVGVQPLALSIGRAWSADIGTLVPIQLEPVQGVEDLALTVLAEPRPVGVLDPQEEPSALLAREREVEQGHVCRADVRVPGRGRRHAQAHGAGQVRGVGFAHGVAQRIRGVGSSRSRHPRQ